LNGVTALTSASIALNFFLSLWDFSTTFRRHRNLFFFDPDFKLFEDASEFSITSLCFFLFKVHVSFSWSQILLGKRQFLVPFGGYGQRRVYNVHLNAHWKVRSRLPISINWSFLLDVTAEALERIWTENRRFHSNGGRLTQNFRY